MKQNTIKTVHLTAEEGKLLVSKATHVDEATGIEVWDVITDDIYLGVEATAKDFKELPKEEVDEVLQQIQEAHQNLQEESQVSPEEGELVEEAEVSEPEEIQETEQAEEDE